MEARFLATTDLDSVARAAANFAETADINRYYSMAEIVSEIYSVEYDTEEFWRVAPGVGETIRSHGFKQVNYKNRRFWVKKVGAGGTAHND